MSDERAASPAPAGLDELFDHYVEQDVLHGTALDAEELCRGRPELLEPLLAYIRDYRRLAGELSLPDRDGFKRDLEAGSSLLHFRIVDKLGEGGMGQVYVAEDEKLGRRVALKVLAPEMADNPHRLERFRREARALAALSHPNIVTVHSVEEDGAVHFLTMELVEGTTLSRRILSRGMPLDRLFAVAVAVADALAAAHEAGITHRDLKPDNVMIDAKGRVKVLDFGLAKRAPAGRDAEPDAGQQTTLALTEDGRILGTMPYMSPEQLMAGAVDARSDIFSLGIMLYEMATGGRPFAGANPAQLISSILRDHPASVTDVRIELPRHLGRIVRRCLEKDPERRYQSVLDVRNELQDLWREIESGEATTASGVLPEGGKRNAGVAAPRKGKAGRRWLPAAVAVAAALVAIAAGYLQSRPGEEPVGAPATVAAPAAEHSLAVLYFQNLGNDPQLDWLRSGITDLLVTDLSQSPEIDVLSTGRLYQILKELDVLDEPAHSFAVVKDVAERGGVQSVVRGSYARAGEVLRVAFTVEDAASGAILESDHVDGRGEESLFDVVDRVTAGIRRSFEVERPAAAGDTVRAVTTSSLEAWRYFSEAGALQWQSKRRDVIALLEKAIEIDPQFALALANLGTAHRGLGHTARAREYTRRAVELANRLPLDDRHAVEAIFYASRWATLDRAVDAFGEGLRLYPDRTALRNNLAEVYTYLERYDEAIGEYSALIDDGTTFPGNYTAIANVYAGQGRFETGYQILLSFAEGHPDNWFTQFWLGWLLTEWGKLDQALERFQRAASLRPREVFVHYGRWRTQVLREDWQQAELEAARMREMADLFARWRGAVSTARNLTYRGRSEEALRFFDQAIGADPEPGPFTALSHCWKAELLLQRGEADQALPETDLARQAGLEEWPELLGLFLAALANQELGREVKASELESELRQRVVARPNVVEQRQLHHLSGRLALARGDLAAAVRALRDAESLLPPEGIEAHWHVYPVHVAIWSALGEAELAAGRPEAARGWFEKAVTSGAEHLESPVPYVRSFYFLGRIHRQLGDAAAADRYFERFLELWQGGDLDRRRLAEAGARIRTEGEGR